MMKQLSLTFALIGRARFPRRNALGISSLSQCSLSPVRSPTVGRSLRRYEEVIRGSNPFLSKLLRYAQPSTVASD